jgi:hypothetical protein
MLAYQRCNQEQIGSEQRQITAEQAFFHGSTAAFGKRAEKLARGDTSG